MAVSYEESLAQLMQSPHQAFVAERKRLSAQLKADGNKEAAARLARVSRPPVSAWAVNQLWWQARGLVEKLFALAARVQAGERAALAGHREAMTELRTRAAQLLQAGGHAASEATLRQVTMTLGALAASGGFEPDLPGSLSADRDPPGFEAIGIGDAAHAEVAPPSPKAEHERSEKPSAAERERERARERAERERERAEREHAEKAIAAERERERAEKLMAAERERERAARRSEYRRLQAALQHANSERDAREHDAAERRSELAAAEQKLEKARAAVSTAEQAVQAFGDPDSAELATRP